MPISHVQSNYLHQPEHDHTFSVEFQKQEGISFGAEEDKMGWRSQPTATVIFDNVRVPKSHLLGKEGDGFKIALTACERLKIFYCTWCCYKVHASDLSKVVVSLLSSGQRAYQHRCMCCWGGPVLPRNCNKIFTVQTAVWPANRTLPEYSVQNCRHGHSTSGIQTSCTSSSRFC